MSKLVKLTLDDYISITSDDIGNALYYAFACVVWEYRIKSVTPKRVVLVTEADEMHPRRYLNADNYMRWYRLEK